MNKFCIKLIGVLLISSFLGCASSGTSSMPNVETTKQFKFSAVNFKFEQLITPSITYHTEKELATLLNNRITTLLQEKELLSKQESMNTLNITTFYQRRFVGDATPLPSDSLAPPHYAYKIEVLDGSTVIKTVERKDLIFKGGMAMNFKILTGSLRDKKDELGFIDGNPPEK